MAESNATEENLDLMQIFKAVIAARNNVPGARNGLSVEMEGKIVVIYIPTCAYDICVHAVNMLYYRTLCRNILIQVTKWV